MIPTLFIVGASGSGKTTVIEEIVKILVSRELSVGYIKHGPPNFSMDVEGKDSHRLYKAGAKAVAIENGNRVGLNLCQWSNSGPIAIANELFPQDLDLIIIEGHKNTPYEKVEVFRQAHSKSPCCQPEGGVIAYITDDGSCLSPDIKHLPIDDFEAVADFVHEWQRDKAAFIPETAKITVDGKPLPINDFVSQTLGHTVRALLNNLRGAGTHVWVKITVDEMNNCQVRATGPNNALPLKPFIQQMVGSTLRGFLMSLDGGPEINSPFTIELAAEEPKVAKKTPKPQSVEDLRI